MKKLFWVYFFLLVLYAIFSYSLTDPNLVLTTWAPYWNFQQMMWKTFFLNAPLMTEIYVALISALFIVYFWLMKKGNFRLTLVTGALLILPLFFSYNALSHDVFNYIFNAKIVLVYHGDPNQKVALDYPQDEWVRFMNNTHTPAPYGFAWTTISLVPYTLGFGKFLPTWLLFRLFSVLSLGWLFLAMRYLAKKMNVRNLEVVFLNPLFLIEIISDSHNDLWMMAPAVYAIALVVKEKKFSLWKVVLSLLLILFSAQIKLASILLLPIWAYFVIQQFKLIPQIKMLEKYWPSLAAILLFLPLLSDRSQQFNPWYLTWVLVWLPFIQLKWLRYAILVLSVNSMLRYVPWLWNGYFTDQIILQQKMITWVPLVVFLIGYGGFSFISQALHGKIQK